MHTRVFTVFYTGNDNRDYQSQLRNKIYVGNNLAARSRSHEYARGPRGINRSNTHAHTRVTFKNGKSTRRSEIFISFERDTVTLSLLNSEKHVCLPIIDLIIAML